MVHPNEDIKCLLTKQLKRFICFVVPTKIILQIIRFGGNFGNIQYLDILFLFFCFNTVP